MAYGIKCWNKNGDVVLDSESDYTRFIYSKKVDTDKSGSVDLPDIDGRSTMQFAIPLTVQWSDPFCAHSVTRSGTTIYWHDLGWPGTALILVFLYT